jgi:hypothetical protein
LKGLNQRIAYLRVKETDSLDEWAVPLPKGKERLCEKKIKKGLLSKKKAAREC